ncbi:hypothetical protein E2542_SST02772 [Spatholobus suberectus]|nr:hypothetical protein E2542_SST02772 [Spatholobus suberectus]
MGSGSGTGITFETLSNALFKKSFLAKPATTMAVAARKVSITETSGAGPLQLPVAKTKDKHCGNAVEWNAVSLQLAATSSTHVFC